MQARDNQEERPATVAGQEYQVYIKGTPETGEQVSADFKVKVVAP